MAKAVYLRLFEYLEGMVWSGRKREREKQDKEPQEMESTTLLWLKNIGLFWPKLRCLKYLEDGDYWYDREMQEWQTKEDVEWRGRNN